MNGIVIATITPETVADLRQRKIIRQEAEQSVELEPVGPGEVMVGVLTEEERVLYVEMVSLGDEIDDRQRELVARSAEKLAEAIRSSKNPDEITKNYDNKNLFMDDADAEEFFALQARLEYVRSVFGVSIRERYGYGSILGVRVGFTVVRAGYKYQRSNAS